MGRNFVSMNIAVIGDGELGERFTNAFAMAGHEVYVAAGKSDNDSKYDRMPELAGITPCSIEDAAAIADFIIIATPPQDVREVAYWLGDVRRKVIIDLTSNITIPENEVLNTLGAINAITGSQNIVKVFSTAGYEHLLKPLFNGERPEMLLAGDCRKAKEVTKIISAELGISRFYDFGGLENVALLDELARSCKQLIKTAFYPKININPVV